MKIILARPKPVMLLSLVLALGCHLGCSNKQAASGLPASPAVPGKITSDGGAAAASTDSSAAAIDVQLAPSSRDAEETARSFYQAVSQHRAKELWAMMPSRWQHDVTTLIGEVDGVFYDQVQRIFVGVLHVLKYQRSLLFNCPIMANPQLDKVGTGRVLDQLEKLLDVITADELRTFTAVRKLDTDTFLSTHGEQILRAVSNLIEATPVADRFLPPESIGGSDSALDQVRLTWQGEPPRDIAFTCDNEKKWVPVAWNEALPGMMTSAREKLAGWKSDRTKAEKTLIQIETAVKQSAQAKTQDEFDQCITSLVAEFLSSSESK